MKHSKKLPLSGKPSAKYIWGLTAATCFLPSVLNAENPISIDETASVQQSSITVNGNIIDETGMPMIGVAVQVKGTTEGTASDFDGNFSITVSRNQTLVISYLGYITREIKVTNAKPLSIKLAPDTKTLDEVVVVGYGTVKKKDLTGAVTSMKSSDVVISPTNDAMEALSGKIAGLDITKSSGEIGEDVSILLRGSRSIYGDNKPLFIIDGIQGDYNQINPSDIESIDVLKDASSTAIYGSAGANGVIIITTKRGKEGKVSVNFDAYYGFSGSPEFPHGMMGDEWTNYQRESYRYKNGQYPADMSAILTNQGMLDAYNQGKWIDWVEEATGNTATTQKYSLSITGGNEKTKIFSSVSYSREEGLLPNNTMDRYAMRMNIDQQIFSWVKAGFTSNLTYRDRDRGEARTFAESLRAVPFGDMRDSEGNLNHEYVFDNYSPLGDYIENQYMNNTKSTYINVNGNLELTPVKGLSIKTVLSATLYNSRLGQYWGAQCGAMRPTYAGSPHASITNNYRWAYNWENIVSYNTTIKDHNLGATFVTSWAHNQNETNMAASSGQDIDSWSIHNLKAGTSPHVESSFARTQKMSYAVRFNYSFKGKYLFTFSNRWDGVSWLADGHKWDTFPAAALGWRISDENFMESSKSWLDNLKLRVGYGVTGNSGGIGAYGTRTQAQVYSDAGITINGQIVPFLQYTGTYSNPTMGWEKSYNWNVGLDFGVLNNRIDGSIEYFTTTTKGLLFKRALPTTSGNTGWGKPLSVWENLAETSNMGVEVTINSHNFKRKDFSWDTTLSLTWSKEKINSLPSGDLINEKLFEGQPIQSFYDYKYLGIWGTDTPQETLDAYGVKPGWIKVDTNDKNGDGGVHKYGDHDKQILGHKNPNVIVGLNNTFTYKWFDLSIFAMARYGQTIESKLIGQYTAKDGVNRNNQPAGADYWTENNQNAFYPVPGSGDEQKTMASLRYHDGSFIKIKNITLGYTLPKHISKKALMEKCRFYATAYNPFLYVKSKQLRGTDPENGGSDSFPLYKQFVFGVNITF